MAYIYVHTLDTGREESEVLGVLTTESNLRGLGEKVRMAVCSVETDPIDTECLYILVHMYVYLKARLTPFE